jgi:hypothetical protein
MENNIPTASEFMTDEYQIKHYGTILLKPGQAAIEFAKLHVEKIKDLQQSKYYAGETGYIKKEEWEELLTNIK